MSGSVPAHCNELLLYLKQVGTDLASSEQITERVWGLHLLEDWKTLLLWSQTVAEHLDEVASETDPVQAEAPLASGSV